MTFPGFEDDTNVATSIVDKTAGLIERRTSRRGLLVRLTVLGSALTLGPVRYLLYPETALAACSGCANPCPSACGGSCACTSTCCSSPNSTFCCTKYGSNVCPGGSDLCGSWSCGNTSLKMMDCCYPQSTCGSCRCEGGNCGNRRTCCFSQEWTNCGGNSGVIDCRITRLNNSCFPCSSPMNVPTCTSVPSCALNPPC
jgi:hypothetical protein